MDTLNVLIIEDSEKRCRLGHPPVEESRIYDPLRQDRDRRGNEY